MSSKILVPLDTAREAEVALPLARALSAKLDDEILLLAVVPPELHLGSQYTGYVESLARMTETRRAGAAAYLDRLREELLGAGIPASSQVRVGPIAETILDTARAEDVGLIAMATHGRVGPERWFLGSVADQVVRTADRPVLLVRPGEGGVVLTGAPTDIIVPLDGSELAEEALPMATTLAKSLGASITIVRAVPAGWWSTPVDAGAYVELPELIESVEAEARQYLERTADILKAQGVRVATRFALFTPPDLEIAEAAKASERPLVVMTSHGRSGIGRVVLGSVADRVVRSSTAPVIVTRGAPRS